MKKLFIVIIALVCVSCNEHKKEIKIMGIDTAKVKPLPDSNMLPDSVVIQNYLRMQDM